MGFSDQLSIFKKQVWLFLITIVLALCIAGCGSSLTSGSETSGDGLTSEPIGLPVTIAKLTPKVGLVGGALIPSATSQGASQSVSQVAFSHIRHQEAAGASTIDYASEATWNSIINDPGSLDDPAYLVTDIFGLADDDPAPASRIRVVLDQTDTSIEGLFIDDPDTNCRQADVLEEGDTINVAFYGEIQNGTADNRYYRCVTNNVPVETGWSVNGQVLYGYDNDNIFRAVFMSEADGPYTGSYPQRGENQKVLSVKMVVYAEGTTETSSSAYLDVQYAQMGLYSGVDDEYDTSDDVFFRSRTRITGAAGIDGAGNAVLGQGEFSVTKDDKDFNDAEQMLESVTYATGRGSYGEDENSLFETHHLTELFNDVADTEPQMTEELEGLFCIKQGESLPLYESDTSLCQSYEQDYAWGPYSETEEFPFTLGEDLTTAFVDMLVFQDNNTDLISTSGANFSIPDSYLTAD
ncbi:MAG: hypothetical protein HQM16_09935 [Deltaproteobacteria bacterium]|nr:hypothetical protein [Deltaproteobacteria bacterium]